MLWVRESGLTLTSPSAQTHRPRNQTQTTTSACLNPGFVVASRLIRTIISLTLQFTQIAGLNEKTLKTEVPVNSHLSWARSILLGTCNLWTLMILVGWSSGQDTPFSSPLPGIAPSGIMIVSQYRIKQHLEDVCCEIDKSSGVQIAIVVVLVFDFSAPRQGDVGPCIRSLQGTAQYTILHVSTERHIAAASAPYPVTAPVIALKRGWEDSGNHFLAL